MKPNLTLATITNDTLGNRGVMLEGLDLLSKKGYQVIVSDGGSSEDFISSIGKMGHKVQRTECGLTSQLKQSILTASELSDVVLYTEMDKLKWIRNNLNEAIDAFFRSGYDLAAVSRTPEQMKTFPVHQQMTETLFNDWVTRKLSLKSGGDYVYGPKFFTREIGKTLASIDEDLGWGTIVYPIPVAYNRGLSIGCLPFALECPLNQRDEKNEDYRMKQLIQHIRGFLLGLKV